MRIGLFLALLAWSTPSFAAEPFAISPAPGQIFIGEGGKWTKWNVLAPGQTFTIEVKEPAEMTVSLRQLFGASAKEGGTVSVDYGPETSLSRVALSGEKVGAVVHKSKDTVGKARTLRQRIAEPTRLSLRTAPNSPPVLFLVEGVPYQPAANEKTVALRSPEPAAKFSAKPTPKPVVPAEQTAEKKEHRFFVEPRPGFFVGKGTFRGFRGELAAGYIPGWLDGMFAIVVQGGYYGATAEQKLQDVDIGTITRNWDLTAIPVGAIVRWHVMTGEFKPYVGGGFDYTRVSFEYTATISAGSLQEPKNTGLNSFLGPRGAAGVSWELGPGELNGELAMTYAYLPQDAHGNASQILAPVVFAGYAYAF
jgi:hypothetical protein